MLTLAITHNIFLTSEQRHDLYHGNTIEVVGVSVPVWFFKGNTSEPATEVFCKYIITNQPEDYPLTAFVKGYKINVPQLPSGHKIAMRPSEVEWDGMTIAEQDAWKRDNPMPPNFFDLLDVSEGGLESLKFKRYNKIKDNGKRLNAIHNIEIQSMELLKQSLTS